MTAPEDFTFESAYRGEAPVSGPVPKCRGVSVNPSPNWPR